MRLRVEDLEHGQRQRIHVAVKKKIEKKGFKNTTKIWAVLNDLMNNGVKVILEMTISILVILILLKMSLWMTDGEVFMFFERVVACLVS